MKKYIFFLLLPIFFWGCEKKYDSLVDVSNPSYQVEYSKIESPNSDSTIIYSPFDSLITIKLKLVSANGISGAYCNIYSPDGSQFNENQIDLFDNGSLVNGDTVAGDNIFSNKFPFSRSYTIGLYSVRFFITDLNNEKKTVAVQNFYYDNGQNNLPPQISDLFAPNTVAVDSPKSVILLTIKAVDPNGQKNIRSVYFIVYRPNGTTSGEKNFMLDNGDSEKNGDSIAGDSIYSLLIEVTPANAKGTYRFDFQAVDWGGKQSDILSHNIVIN